MIKKIVDMRNGISKEFDKDEKILNVYFLIEENPTDYHLCTPLIQTNKAIYVDRRNNYSFESSDERMLNLRLLINEILKKDSNINLFKVLCVKNEDLKEIENSSLLEIKQIPAPVFSEKANQIVNEAQRIISNIYISFEEKNLEKKTSKNKNILIYNVPIEWVEILKENGITFSSYAKVAILEKLKRDGLIN